MTSRHNSPERWFPSATTIGAWSIARRLSATQPWCRLKASTNPASPQISSPEIVVEMPDGGHRLLKNEGERGEGGGRRDDAGVVGRRMRDIAGRVVAGGQAPAVRAITAPAMRIGQAVRPVDQRVRPRLNAIVGIGVREPARVDAEERVLRKEQRPAPIRPERQLDSGIAVPVPEGRGHGPALVVDLWADRVCRRAGGEHEDRHRLVPAPDRQRVRRPVPRRVSVPHQLGAAPHMRGPVHRAIEPLDPAHQLGRLGEILGRREQAGHQERRLYQVAAVIARHEGQDAPRRAAEEMRKDAVEAVGPLEKGDDALDPVEDVAPRPPAALGRDELSHDAEPGAARCHRVLDVIAEGPGAALARHAADGMAPVGEVGRGRLRDPVEQRGVVEAPRQVSHVISTDCVSRLFGPTCRTKVPGSHTSSAASSEGATV